MKPIIGLLVKTNDECESIVQNTYIKAIEGAGGLPIVLPFVKEKETIADFLSICDGILFTGGVDIAPERYGEEKKETCGAIEYYRDDLEFRVFSQLFATDKPILAICRGSQLVNVALGGTLYQDIPTETNATLCHKQTEPTFSPSHEVRVLEGTPLHKLVVKDRMTANSFHHQAVKTLGRGLEVMAIADDGIIEGFFLTGERYLRAYQWHPERLFDNDGNNRQIFEDFISACTKK